MCDRYKTDKAKCDLATEIGDRFPNERAFQNHVIWLAKAHGWLVYHTFNSRKSAPGFPDLVLVRVGRCIFAELKTDKSKPTKDQRKWLAELNETPCETYLWRPKDLREITEILARKETA